MIIWALRELKGSRQLKRERSSQKEKISLKFVGPPMGHTFLWREIKCLPKFKETLGI